MRRAITLEPDVEARLRVEMRRRGVPFEQVVNDLLRQALVQPASAPPPRFKVRAGSLGLRAGVNLDNVGSLLDEFDGSGDAAL